MPQQPSKAFVVQHYAEALSEVNAEQASSCQNFESAIRARIEEMWQSKRGVLEPELQIIVPSTPPDSFYKSNYECVKAEFEKSAAAGLELNPRKL